MKGQRNISDEQLALMIGEAMTEQPSAEETLAAWDAFEKKHAEEMEPKQKLQVHKGRRAFKASLAVVALAAAAAILLFIFLPSKEVDASANPLELYSEVASPAQVEQTLEDGICRVATPAATTTLVTLGDGTQVTLNANSALEYPRSFDGSSTREVRLRGEAHFEVTKNPHQPFVVVAGNMKTQVLGTVFDVKAYRASSPKVVLMEGHVKVSNQETSVDMQPGQTATLESDKIIVTKSLPGDVQDWQKGEFNMDQVTLAEAMADIGAWYNKSVVFKNEASMGKLIHFRFSRRASLGDIIMALNEMGIAKIENKNGKIVVY